MIASLTAPQSEVFLDESRYRVWCAARRVGKSTTGVCTLLYDMLRYPGALVWYVAPTYQTGKDNVWRPLMRHFGEEAFSDKSESEMYLRLNGWNSELFVKSALDPDRLRGGPGQKCIIFDEVKDMKPEVWEVTRPGLTNNLGFALFMGTPGGYDWFYRLYSRAVTLPEWSTFTHTTLEGGLVPEAEIEECRKTMHPKMFAQEMLASFESFGNRVYYAFDRKRNVCEAVSDEGGDVMVGMDFNVNPMTAVIGQKRENCFYQWDEILIPDSNTDEMCIELKNRFADRQVIVYPDPTGIARKSSAPIGTTDISIIKDHGFKLKQARAPQSQKDKVNQINALCSNAKGEARFYVHPRCAHTIESMEGLVYKNNTSLPDKSLGMDHLPDALGNIVRMHFAIYQPESGRVQITGY